jgi:hypothetical protein
MIKAFNHWWDSDALTQMNPYSEDSPAFWAWEGWVAATKAAQEKLDEHGVGFDLGGYHG